MIFGGGEGGGSLRDHDGSNDATHTTSVAMMCEGKMRVGQGEVTVDTALLTSIVHRANESRR